MPIQFNDDVCSKCPLFGSIRVPSDPDFRTEDESIFKRRVFIVGQAPGAKEVQQGRPFVGESGSFLMSMLQLAGLSRKDVYITNACKCRPVDKNTNKDAEPTKEMLSVCRYYLEEELRRASPQIIVAVGKVALRQLLPNLGNIRIDSYVGRFLDSPYGKIFVVRHPAGVLRAGSVWLKRAYMEHMKKLKDYLDGSINLVDVTQMKVIEDPEDDWYTKFNADQDIVTVDLETPGDLRVTSDILTCAFSNGEETVVVPVLKIGDDPLKRALQFFHSQSYKFNSHNAEFDLKVLNYRYDLLLEAGWDTLQCEHVLDEEAPLDLDSVVPKYVDTLPHKNISWSWKDPKLAEKVSNDRDLFLEMCMYNARDAFLTHLIFRKQKVLIEQDPYVKSFYNNFTLPLLNAFLYCSKFGVPIDVSALMGLEKELDEVIQKYLQELYIEVGREFNVNSLDQLEVIFSSWGVSKKVTGTTETGKMQLTKDVLESLSQRDDRVGKVADLILKIRASQKLKNTYIDQLKDFLYVNKYTGLTSVSPSYKLHASTTYRCNTENPNIHNVPRGSPVKKIFAVPSGYKILGFDYKGAEAFHAAMMSKEQKIIEFVLNPELDQHRYTASVVYNKPESEITKEERTNAKLAWFALQYGGTEHALMKDFGMSLDQALKVINGIKKAYPRLFAMFDQLQYTALTQKKLINRFGAVRRFPTWTSSSGRQAMNFPFQSEVSIYCHFAVIDLVAISKVLGVENFRVLYSIHDAIYTMCRDELVPIMCAIQEKVMSMERNGMFLVTDPEVGSSWYDLKELDGEWLEQYLEYKKKDLPELLKEAYLLVERSYGTSRAVE